MNTAVRSAGLGKRSITARIARRGALCQPMMMVTAINAPLTSTKEPPNTWSEIRSHRLARFAKFSSPDSQILREIIVNH